MELYFTDDVGMVHVIEEGFEHLLGSNFPEKTGFTKITKEEADALQAQSEPTASELAQAQIVRMEREQMLPRGTREALLALTIGVAATQGITEPQLYAANIAYKKIKDFDAQIVLLRKQL